MFKPGSFALTTVLGLLIALGPMSTDMYLPSLPAIGRAFASDASAVQLTLSGFLVGFAFGQILYGPVSDRIGRRPALAAGLGLYCLGSALCAAAWSIDTLVAARILQALGAAGPVVLARAIVRDLYEGDRAGQELSRMGSIMGFVPAVAPVAGAALEVAFGWRANFAGALALGLVTLWLVGTRLPETLRTRLAGRISFAAILGDYASLLGRTHFRLYALLVAATYGGLFSFISGSSFVLQGLYGLSEIGFGVAFGSCALAYVAGTLIGRRLVLRIGMRRAITAGAGLLAAGGGAMVLALAVGPHHYAGILVPMLVYMIGVGVGFPLSQAAAIMPYPSHAGAASSLSGFLQMTFAAAVGIAVAAGAARTAWSLAGAVGALGLAALATERLAARLRL